MCKWISRHLRITGFCWVQNLQMGIKDKIILSLKSIPVISLGNYGLTFKSSVVKEIVSQWSQDIYPFLLCSYSSNHLYISPVENVICSRIWCVCFCRSYIITLVKYRFPLKHYFLNEIEGNHFVWKSWKRNRVLFFSFYFVYFNNKT